MGESNNAEVGNAECDVTPRHAASHRGPWERASAGASGFQRAVTGCASSACRRLIGVDTTSRARRTAASLSAS